MASKLLFEKYSARVLGAGPVPVDSRASQSRGANKILEAQRSSSLYNEQALQADPLKKPKEERESTLGKGWFDMKPVKMDEKLKQDVELIRMRNYLDPKRFYKNPDKVGAVLGVGTVVEGSAEYKSARLSRKERKQSIMEEVLADKQLKSYNKRTFLSIQEQRSKKRRAHKHKKSNKF